MIKTFRFQVEQGYIIETIFSAFNTKLFSYQRYCTFYNASVYFEMNTSLCSASLLMLKFVYKIKRLRLKHFSIFVEAALLSVFTLFHCNNIYKQHSTATKLKGGKWHLRVLPSTRATIF